MSLTLSYSDPRGIEEPAALVSLGSNVAFGTLGLALSAELAEPAISTVEVQDPGGVYNFVGLRAFDARETSAASNNQIVGRFVIQDREIKRSPEHGLVTGADRLWSMDLTDYNWHVGKRILVDSDSKRPAETAGDRLRWLLHNAAHISLNDYGHVTYPSHALDAHDYRGETAATVLSDCCVEGGYNFWVDFNEAHGRPELFFIDPNDSADAYVATIGISNVLADVDNALVFAPYDDAQLKRSPTRIAYGVYLPYSGGAVYVRRDETGDEFAQVDQAAPMATVHTAARATRIANKFLNDNDSETDRIACSIKVPAAQVNDVRHGQLIAARFSDLPGYETPQKMRVLQKTVQQDEEGGGTHYRIGLEMVPLDPPATGSFAPGGSPSYTAAAFAGAQLADGNLGTLVWDYVGDHPGPGFNVNPTVGPLSAVAVAGVYNDLTTTEPIVVRVSAAAGFAAVFSAGGFAMITCTSSVNGIIGTGSLTSAGGGFLAGAASIEIPTYTMVAGEVLTFTGSYHGVLAGGGWGSSANDTYIRIGRGTHNWGSGGSAETWVGP